MHFQRIVHLGKLYLMDEMILFHFEMLEGDYRFEMLIMLLIIYFKHYN
jgi:hypothetical protein